MNDKKPFLLKFFLPDARVLSESEIDSLPAEKVQSVKAAGKEGFWLEINCPDGSCLDADGKITLPVQKSKDEGIFLDLFCPEGSCEILQGTDLP